MAALRTRKRGLGAFGAVKTGLLFSSFLLAPLLLWGALKDAPLSDVRTITARVGVSGMLALSALNLLVILAMAARWRVFINACGRRIGPVRLGGYRMAANAVSYFTPGPHLGGEPLQAYLLRRIDKVPLGASIASVAVDKLMDIAANALVITVGTACGLYLGIFHFSQHPKTAFLAAAALLMSILAVLRAIRGRKSGRFEKAARDHGSFRVPAVLRMRSRGNRPERPFCLTSTVLLRTLPASLSLCASLVVEFWLVFRLLGVSLTPAEILVAITAARLAFLTPIPAGAGALEAGQALVLQSFGYHPALGLSACLVIRARDLIFGLAGLGLAGAYLSAARRRNRKGPASEKASGSS